MCGHGGIAPPTCPVASQKEKNCQDHPFSAIFNFCPSPNQIFPLDASPPQKIEILIPPAMLCVIDHIHVEEENGTKIV